MVDTRSSFLPMVRWPEREACSTWPIHTQLDFARSFTNDFLPAEEKGSY
jgi:hypothetical protein